MSRTEKHPYTKAKAVSKHCRNSNGKCLYCSGNRTYKNDKKSWKILSQKSASFYLVLMVAVGVFSSCGKRTTSYSITEIKTDTLQYNGQFELRQNITLFDVFSLYPIDNTKPIIYNGISYYNASIRFDKSKFENIEIIAKENLSQGSVSSLAKEKKTEKTDYGNVYIGLFFVFCLFVFAWFKKWF